MAEREARLQQAQEREQQLAEQVRGGEGALAWPLVNTASVNTFRSRIRSLTVVLSGVHLLSLSIAGEFIFRVGQMRGLVCRRNSCSTRAALLLLNP